ncbi:folate/biopterin family MFS transporter [Aphanizomenon flos-aquae NRERC-008]|jgi:folate/biopterin transporter|uniref:Folate/biopterin family MFS transporter n=1 Tax=Aphanizomenon flos-aquae FACHB-1249 TaxID=2692889 RepID=A0ABR8IQT6_APHFL|nr:MULTISPECIES: folate/biopterin family MFS transporter [Aphanizomenon]QSV65652.1 MAG: folate/biopterin family MFS transporter [Aphanizomenon flos-aquae DEX188]MBD2390783.1 folate/biopterin family MFS transporter [Aphanizomenon flos-aquae FACHB-1171]MBD2556339.1 folate/biopterin family MFS transporter [Aphanizomenon flos-aquae FACHB-1290]MBD2631781.1 folate/biopterin family MFS transporter [Aphanizomenon sp. FACHB-1399]MBD2642648.1 folate/biopterin family MFS transporter [Aphanizomenon sp. FA
MLNESAKLPKVKDSLIEQILLGNKLTPELIAILTIYFVQGILMLSRLAVSFFLKDELLLSPAQMSAIIGISTIPWMIKPLYGFIADILPLFGYHRKTYIFLSGIIGSAAWVGLGTIVHSSSIATMMILLCSLSVALSDVIVDSIVVERARSESAEKLGSLQSLCWGIAAIGGLCTAYLSGLLLEYFTTRTVFLITALFPIITSFVAWLITEKPINKDEKKSDDIKYQLVQIRQAITQKAIWLPTVFIFVWHATPNAESAFFYFTTNELQFQPEFLGRVRLVTSFASLIGIWAFQRYFKTIPFRTMFTWGIFISTALGMTTLLLVTHTNRLLGIDDHWFSLGDNLIITVIGQIVFMPVLVLATKLCPPGIEATFFALIMSVFNLGGTVSYWLGSIMMKWLGITEHQFDSLWLLIIITNCSSLIPIFFIKWLPNGTIDIDDSSSI